MLYVRERRDIPHFSMQEIYIVIEESGSHSDFTYLNVGSNIYI